MAAPPSPASPTASVTSSDDVAAITIAIVNPAPTGYEPDVVSNDLFVRALVGTDWFRPLADPVRIATGIPVDGSFIDYSPASGDDYQYQVVAVGENGMTSSSPWIGTPTGHFDQSPFDASTWA